MTIVSKWCPHIPKGEQDEPLRYGKKRLKLLFTVLLHVIELVIYYYITNCHKLSSLKQHKSILSQILEVDGPVGLDSVICLVSHKVKIKLWARPHSLLKTLGQDPLPRYSGGWQNLVLCGYRTDVTVSLLAISCGPVFAPRGIASHCFHGESSSNSGLIFSHTPNHSDLPFVSSL